jgi:dihydrofolate reductase
VAEATQVAADKDVYLAGGTLIRDALDASLIDEIAVTDIPMILSAGLPSAGAASRHPLELVNARSIGGGFVELQFRPRC